MGVQASLAGRRRTDEDVFMSRSTHADAPDSLMNPPTEGPPSWLGAEVRAFDGSLGRLVAVREGQWVVKRGGYLPRNVLIPVGVAACWDETHRRWELDVALIEALSWPDPGPREPLYRTLARLVTVPIWGPVAVSHRLWQRRRQHFLEEMVGALKQGAQTDESEQEGKGVGGGGLEPATSSV